ncbi:MAG: ShlB/FhaC/HecB family hemolysin secretion/activation protein, partial [Leptolyngbya sp. SIO1D8]|nr:ShlB/FhaC/HecB family hemolysin secretion/activation protein [Leptolyngbya sp. SIO1D8]
SSFQTGLSLNNVRTPNVGTLQVGLSLSERNLSGHGDRFDFTYHHTEGSDGLSVGYEIPINAKNGSLGLTYNQSNSQIIESSVESLGIRSDSQYLDLTWRQPLIRTPRQELALGFTGSYRHSRAIFGEEIFGESFPFPTPGADETGKTQVTALRFFQEWTARSETEAFALRSQFSFGVGALGATINADAPDSRFFSWRGQAQWRRRLWPNTFLLMGADVQLADRALLPAEQFALGGLGSVRGYRQNLLLADNGVAATAEVWVPVVRVPNPDVNGILHIVPFVDVGTVWDNGDAPAFDPNVLAATGLGLRWQQEHISMRLDWGIPLIEDNNQGNSLQENGIYFSLQLNRL